MERIKKLPFSEYINSIAYQKEYLPFATQHSIKGSEFDNVLVVLDNGEWNKYNFNSLFVEKNSNNKPFTPSVVQTTRKLFYVCCTRAMKNLVIFMPTSDVNVIEKAKELFGEENHKISASQLRRQFRLVVAVAESHTENKSYLGHHTTA